MARQFRTLDVFTTETFGGNPLAVVMDGQGLSTEEMQTIAAEFNLSETTFILPPADPANDANVRIFTPKAELPFAGHAVPMTYRLERDGRQFVVMAAGGNPLGDMGDALIAFALPE